MNLAETIYQHSLRLPEPAAREVLDFIEFLESRQAQASRPETARLLDPMQFSNTVNWPVEGLEYQRQVRGEWE